MSTPTSSRRKRTTAVAALAAALTTGAAVLAAPAAVAATVSVGYTCTGPGAPADVQPIQVSMTAPASVPAGGTAELSVDVTTSIKAPLTLPARSVTGEMDIVLGGTASGSVTATGFTNAAVVPSGTTVKVTGGKASVKLDAAGTATFAPGKASVHVFGVTVECVVSGTAPVAATTEVTAR
ncbi:hypothetical protein M1P56_14475 [Streptomyces sp. HU2014]|uniref:hypothetical protein n=1 Tax=Streptomyces sp. HU2014 TaxID=2939414 RepID=UPI00200E5AF0|nr:hypothetical protein [Streptomyces sp. HU2014]UQI45469.1 hypothetical protein M1P56_14475 [Streptomyces sp. HU2014]